MRITAALFIAGTFCLGSCRDATGPRNGAVRIQTRTTGGDLDDNGYLLRIDGGPQSVIPANGIDAANLPTGRHVISLVGVARNCDLVGDPVQSVEILASGETNVEFNVVCFATGVELLTRTTGTDFDRTGYYSLRIADSAPISLQPVDAATITRLTPGIYELVLSGFPANCSAENGVRHSVEVFTRHVTVDTMKVRCVATTGGIAVDVVTTGADQDPNGYLVRIGGDIRSVGANATVVFPTLAAGAYDVTLDGIAPNCAVAGLNPTSTVVHTGGPANETSRVSFDVRCTRVSKIAFVQGDMIGDFDEDGSNAFSIARGYAPSWSPAGDQIAYEASVCTGGYGGDPSPPPCQRLGIGIVHSDGTGAHLLTTEAVDEAPAWSPDGSEVAFERSAQIHIIGVDGTSDRALLVPAAWTSEPAWAPDGSRLAFACIVSVGNLDICTINRDGTGFVRLTTDPGADYDPDWSPDGTHIAFTTWRFAASETIALMRADGSGTVPVIAGGSPSWSPDGTRLVFAISGLGLAIANADGTGFHVLTRQYEYAPAWRR